MADGLGLAASIIAAIQLTTGVASLSYEYIGKTTRAPEDISKLMDELKSLLEVLTVLQLAVQANPGSVALQGLDDPLQKCMGEMIKLRIKLEPKKGLKWWSWETMLVRLTWPFEEKETSEFISRIERLKSLFSLALNTNQQFLSGVIKAHVLDIKTGVEVLKARSAVQDLDKQDEKIYQIGRKRAGALNWLYSEAFDKRHTEISGRRQEDTCEWILKKPEVLEWAKKDPNSRLLWGYGIPGAGKTYLSSLMIDHLQGKAQTEGYGVAYIYFNYKEQDRQGLVHVLSSLVKQFACQIPYLPKEIEDLYGQLEPKQKKPTPEELYEILLKVTGVTYFPRTFVICDALDECDQESQRKQLLPLFHRMGGNGISLFLTSREYPEDIQHSLRDSAKMRIRAQDEDITNYIKRKIAENPRADRLITRGNCKDKVVSKLVECANGMFLLAHFQVEYLCKQTTLREVLGELENLKVYSGEEKSLDPTYDRAMDILRSQPKNCVRLALKVLSWLVKGRRVFTVRELQMAVSVEQDRTTFDEQDLPDKKTLIDVCAGLVTIDDTSNTVRLAHYTVQEYLLSHLILPDDADFELAMVCTTFLSFDVFSQGACDTYESRRSLYPFLDYAAKNLGFHLKACDETLTTGVVHKFLGKMGSISSYLQAYYTPQENGFMFRYPKGRVSLHIAAFLGHYPVARILLDRTSAMTADNSGNTILHLAVEKGVDISATDDLGKTALHLAAEGGHEPVVLLLLEKGADISATNRSGETALHLAAGRGHEPVVLLLLEKGADISATDHSGMTALHLAAGRGHEPVVLLLLEKGADISATNRSGETALHLAAGRGHEPVVLLLLEKGADISATDDFGETALHLAAEGGHEPVVLLLLEKGADISATDDSGNTALRLAEKREQKLVVSLLLKGGAEIPDTGEFGRTTLHPNTLLPIETNRSPS